MRWAVLLVLVSSVAWAQADAGSATGVLTRAPALLKQVDAVFPPDAADAGLGGTVVMQLDLGPDGRVTEAKVVGSAGDAFDQAALAAVKQFEFSPAEVDGQPAAVRLSYSYTFFFKREVVEKPVAADAGLTGLINFSGQVLERGTRDVLAGAQVVVGEGAAVQEATSDERGHFELKDVPPGSTRVRVLAPDCQRFEVTEEVKAGERTVVTYYVRKKQYGTFETVVRGQKERKEVAQVTLKQEEIRLIPGTNGDAFRVVQNLPGVARTPYGLGFLIVRGGKPWDTTTYVDEALVPLLFHFGGLFSTYNAFLLDDISFQAGNFDAEYGRSIGGVVRGTVRTPSQKGWHGYFDVNLIDASALVEAPINKDWSFAVSGRRSYIDAILPAVLSLIPGATDAISFTVAPRYYDYQLRLEYHPQKSKTRFFVNVFGSDDQLVAALPNPALDPEGRGSFGTSINYNRLLIGLDQKLTPRIGLKSRTSFGLDSLKFTGGSDLYAKGQAWPVLSRQTFSVEIPEWNLTAYPGLDLWLLPYVVDVQGPPIPKLNQIPDPFATRRIITERSQTFQIEAGLFLDLMWKPLPGLKVVAGVRGDVDTLMAKSWFDPRVSAFYELTEKVTLKAAAGLYHQPPDFRQGQLSKKFGNPNLGPEGARQYMVGTEVHFTDAISLDVQLYYKDLFDQVRSTIAPGAVSDLATEQIDLHYTNVGRGHTYGAEILLRHALTRNFFGWVAYSLSRSERDFYSGTQWGLSSFDQPHNLVVVASYKLPSDFIVGAKLRWVSGALETPYTGAIYDANGNYFFPLQAARNSHRLPDFLQLDVRIDKRFVFRDWMLALYVDVQNVTNRHNVEATLNSYDYSQQAYLSGLPILPVLGVRGEW